MTAPLRALQSASCFCNREAEPAANTKLIMRPVQTLSVLPRAPNRRRALAVPRSHHTLELLPIENKAS